MSQEKIGSFKATDAAGKHHTVEIWADVILTPARGGPTKSLGMKNLLVGGKHLNKIGDGKYIVNETNATLTSTDPNKV